MSKEKPASNTPSEVYQFYDAMLASFPQVGSAFPELRPLKDGGSIYFYKQRAAVLGVQKTNGLYIDIDAECISDPSDYSIEFKARKTKEKKEDGSVIEKIQAYRFYLGKSSENHQSIFALLAEISEEKFYGANVEHFGCCNDFILCSDAKRCLHEENWEYIGCEYRKNIKMGRIFYGKNKNI